MSSKTVQDELSLSDHHVLWIYVHTQHKAIRTDQLRKKCQVKPLMTADVENSIAGRDQVRQQLILDQLSVFLRTVPLLGLSIFDPKGKFHASELNLRDERKRSRGVWNPPRLIASTPQKTADSILKHKFSPLCGR